RERERGHRHLFRDDHLGPLAGIRRVGPQVHPEGGAGAALHLLDGRTKLRWAHRRRRDEAEPARLGGRRGQPGPGHVAHRGLDDRAGDAEQLGQPGPDHGISRSRRPAGSSCPRIRASSWPVGSRVTGTSPGMASGKPVAAVTSPAVTPGWTERSRMVWSAVWKSSTARLVTTTRSSWKRAARGPRAPARSYPT